MSKKMYRQGDVFLKQIEAIPKGLKKKDKILAYGEITNHHHRFANNSPTQVMVDKEGKQYCAITGEAILEHEDHANIKIQEGFYEVTIQREMDIIGVVKKVAD